MIFAPCIMTYYILPYLNWGFMFGEVFKLREPRHRCYLKCYLSLKMQFVTLEGRNAISVSAWCVIES